MCELFAVNSKEPVRLNGYLEEFYSHSVRHPHGWGASWMRDGRAELVKEPLRAIDSEANSEFLSGEILESHLIAHIRNASHGALDYSNCHPFIGEDIYGNEWMLAHNGNVFNWSLLAGYDEWETGETDSECVMMLLMDVLENAALRAGNLEFDVRFRALAGAIDQLSNGNKVNLIMDDGTYTYVHTNTLESTLKVKHLPGTALFSTTALDDGIWEQVPRCRLLAYRDGELVMTSHVHRNLIIDGMQDYPKPLKNCVA
ncbi:MAG: class II glutamine amidotransferase [Coriobacteriales bacterium]